MTEEQKNTLQMKFEEYTPEAFCEWVMEETGEYGTELYSLREQAEDTLKELGFLECVVQQVLND